MTEIVLFQGTPYKVDDVYINVLVQSAALVNNPIALMSPNADITTQFLLDRADARVHFESTWTELLFSSPPPNTGLSTIFYLQSLIRHQNTQLLSVLSAFRYAAMSSTYDRILAVLHTTGFENDISINSNIFSTFQSSKVTIVRALDSTVLLLVPKNQAEWFFDAFEERHAKLTNEAVAQAQSGQASFISYSYSIANGDPTFLYLSKVHPDRVETIDINLEEGEGPASALKRFCLFLNTAAPATTTTIMYNIFFALLVALFIIINLARPKLF